MFDYKLAQRRFNKLNRRETSVAILEPIGKEVRPEGTHFGGIPLGGKDENWPFWNDKPLTFICQLNLTEVPFVPNVLSGIELVTFYADYENLELGSENGYGWRIRTYSTVKDLYPLVVPVAGSLPKATNAWWYRDFDSPCEADPSLIVPEGIDQWSDDFSDMVLSQKLIAKTKLGGYYFPIQSTPWWKPDSGYVHPVSEEARPEFCIQIGSEWEFGLVWGDVGCVYLAKGTAPGHEHRWFLDWACH